MIKDIYGNTRFLGIYRGVVYDVNDPDNKSRIRVKVPQILSTNATDWAWPLVVSPTIPGVGDGVWVQFEGGDPAFPVWGSVFKGTATTSTTSGAVTTDIIDGGAA